jgi:hypothetical protein
MDRVTLQDRDVRELLRRTLADELMVVLLDHDSREVVYTVRRRAWC